MTSVMDYFAGSAAALERNRLYGAYPAQVTDIKDPDDQGRFSSKVPELADYVNRHPELTVRSVVHVRILGHTDEPSAPSR